MQLNQIPAKIELPFANSGAKNTIPVASQIGIVDGRASFADGFPPLTMTPLSAGGVPPFGQDQNGILFMLSAWLRWVSAGGGVPFDNAFATSANVGGLPKGARILRSDGLGYWLNTSENNTTSPEATGVSTGWVPDNGQYGQTVLSLGASNVTLTPGQWGRKEIILSGNLTANVQVIFPDDVSGVWLVKNSTTGNFTVTCKTASGAGAIMAQGAAPSLIWSDGSSGIYASMADFTTLAALFLRNSQNAWCKDSAGVDRLYFDSAGISRLKGSGSVSSVLQNAANQRVGIRSGGQAFADVDAVAADDLPRYAQTSRVGASIGASDWVWLDYANKIIYQWAIVSIPGTGGVVWTFPTAFASSPRELGGNTLGVANEAVCFSNESATSVTVDYQSTSISSNAYVHAVGVKA